MDEDLSDELEMFVEAQDAVWHDVIAELSAGQKRSHWIWFVFPQLASLGQSHMAQLYGIADLEEAAAYLGHPVLGERLQEASRLVLDHANKPPAELMGSEIDALKLRSSMTLFSAVPGAPDLFDRVLDEVLDGKRCQKTLDEVAA